MVLTCFKSVQIAKESIGSLVPIYVRINKRHLDLHLYASSIK